jgi:hypothetical protein
MGYVNMVVAISVSSDPGELKAWIELLLFQRGKDCWYIMAVEPEIVLRVSATRNMGGWTGPLTHAGGCGRKAMMPEGFHRLMYSTIV